MSSLFPVCSNCRRMMTMGAEWAVMHGVIVISGDL